MTIIEITYTTDIESIDWAWLKQRLTEDSFDNGRTPKQYETSFRNSFGVVFAWANEEIIGKARVLSDGICNAYIVDVWTYSPFRSQGIASEMLKILEATLQGQHVYLFT
ncbi:MAG: GNAT family N-acetyltransferase, partial [Chloroflexota bacterium]